jgi:hypothetical protein
VEDTYVSLGDNSAVARQISIDLYVSSPMFEAIMSHIFRSVKPPKIDLGNYLSPVADIILSVEDGIG